MAGLVLFSGCSGGRDHSRGKALLESGQYDEAVEAFRKAVVENPGSRRYRLSLAEAESLAADRHVERAEQLVAEHRLTDARRELQIALGQVPAYPRGLAMVQQVDSGIDRCRPVVDKARSAFGRGDLDEASRLVDEASRIDASFPAAQELRKTIIESAVARHLEPAEKAFAAGDFDACLSACAEAKKLDPSNDKVIDLEKKARDRKEALQLLAAARPMIEGAGAAGAMNQLEMADRLWPENADITAALDRARTETVQHLITTADEKLAAGDLVSALHALDQAEALGGTREDVAQRRRRMSDLQVARQLDAYERHVMAGEWELAWTLAIEALVAVPDSPRAQQACLRAEKAIRRALDQPEPATRTAAPDSVPGYVTYLFARHDAADRRTVDDFLGFIFGSRLSGTVLADCKRIVIERLDIRFTPAVASRPARPAPETEPAVVVSPPPPTPVQPVAPGKPVVPPARQDRPTYPVRVFTGVVSRDDDRYPTEMLTIDGIIVKVRDTDESPLDADIEIRVGDIEKEYDDLRVGTRLRGRGLSGRPYVLVILRIVDEDETMYFALELDQQRR